MTNGHLTGARRLRKNAWRLATVALAGALYAGAACSPAKPPPDDQGTAARGSGGSANGTGTGGTTPSGGTTSTGGTIGVTGGSSGSISMGGSLALGGMGGSGASDCAATSTEAKLIPLDLYVLTDSSKSMLEMTSGGVSKWEALKDAMLGFFSDPTADGLSVALKYFPDEEPGVPAACTDDTQCGAVGPCDQRKACVSVGTFSKTLTALCTTDADCNQDPDAGTPEVCAPVQRCGDGPNCAKVYCVSAGPESPCTADCVPFDGYCRSRDVCAGANYATPAVPMAALPGAAAALTESLNARMPDGFTPTGPALTGALQFAQAHQTATPTHQVAVVLVTDGLPGGFIPNMPPPACVPGDIAGVATLVQMGATGTPPIPTFVIGVFGPCDLVDQNIRPQENLDLLAQAGGTERAVLISTDTDVVAQLREALGQVRKTAIACRYATPTVEAGSVDYLKVNVNFTAAPGSMPATLNYVGSAAACDPTTGGWYYDADPKAGGTPTEIIACEQSCAQFQAAAAGRVDIAYGCPTVEVR